MRRIRSDTAVAGPPTTTQANAALCIACPIGRPRTVPSKAALIMTAISAVVTSQMAATVTSHPTERHTCPPLHEYPPIWICPEPAILTS